MHTAEVADDVALPAVGGTVQGPEGWKVIWTCGLTVLKLGSVAPGAVDPA